MAPEDLLLAARDVMRERGLARRTFQADNGTVCLSGALMVGSRGERCHVARALGALGEVCWERYGTLSAPIANDEHIATVDEACDVLEAAAKRAASKGVADD